MITVELKGQTSVKYADLDEEKTRTIYEGHVLSRNVAEEPALAIGSERVG